MLDGIAAQDLIARALAPGIALTALIFYNSSLQNRFVYITGRVRENSREVRQLRADNPARHAARLANLRAQVDLMLRRSRVMRRAVLLVYGAFGSMIFTILALAGSLVWPWLELVSLASFSLGFVFLGLAAALSASEMFMALRTLDMEVASTFGEDAPDGRGPSGT